jgi:UDP-glucuronate 4-epimerase
VIGIDNLSDTYSISTKIQNLAVLNESPLFDFHRLDLARQPFDGLISDCDVVFHLAGQPGTRQSWGPNFDPYLTNNVLTTQRVLEAAVVSGSRMVFASSSSVYGQASTLPVTESVPPKPLSPYAASKLSAEILCRTYARVHGLPLVILRYFSVYGPRQRPDMAFSRFLAAVLDGRPIGLAGTGQQRRDFTYVSDAVAATVAAGQRNDAVGETINIGAGEPVSLATAITLISEYLGVAARVERRPEQADEPSATHANVSRGLTLLGYSPRVAVEEGLLTQARWAQAGYAAGGRTLDATQTLEPAIHSANPA